MTSIRLSWTLAPALCAAAVGCGGREPHWDDNAKTPIDTYGLTGSVAVMDVSLNRALMLTVPTAGQLVETPLRVGHHVKTVTTSPDRSKLFVLSAGDTPRRTAADQAPSLTLIDSGPEPSVLASIPLTDPLTGLSVDPLGEWAVVYDATGVVTNRNELIFVDLRDTSKPAVSFTIRSSGGSPQRLTFTTPLAVPKGDPRRFLLVETQRDVTLLDLEHLDTAHEVTVVLPLTATGSVGRPLQVAYHDGDPTDPTDARIAVRLANDSNVVLLQLVPAPSGDARDFQTTVNVADVGGVPSAIDFVQTDGGLRLAALVPASRVASLVDPATTVVEQVSLPSAFSAITRVTSSLSEKPDVADAALLYSADLSGVALWALGRTTGSPFRSVEQYDTQGIAISAVHDVPGDTFGHLKILESSGNAEFFVFDLDKRENSPMLANATGFEITLSPDGARAWALHTGTPEFASISLDDLHPTSVIAERDVFAVHDVARGGDGGRAVIALHAVESGGAFVGATVLDAQKPDTADSRYYGGILLGGLQ